MIFHENETPEILQFFSNLKQILSQLWSFWLFENILVGCCQVDFWRGALTTNWFEQLFLFLKSGFKSWTLSKAICIYLWLSKVRLSGADQLLYFAGFLSLIKYFYYFKEKNTSKDLYRGATICENLILLLINFSKRNECFYRDVN